MCYFKYNLNDFDFDFVLWLRNEKVPESLW